MSTYNDNEKPFDVKTIVAVGLMVAVFAAGTFVQRYFFPAPKPQETHAAVNETPQENRPAAAQKMAPVPETKPDTLVLTDNEGIPQREILQTVSTNLFDVTFSSKGGNIVSLKLKQHQEKNIPVELLLSQNGKTKGCSLAFGGPSAPSVSEYMSISRPSATAIAFERTFAAPNSSGTQTSFVLQKLYEFIENDYMFKLTVRITSADGSVVKIGDDTAAYTMTLGPQIGPQYANLPQKADWRSIIAYENGKRKNIKAGVQTVADSKASWSAIAGKYFALIAVPEAAQYTVTYTNTTADGYPAISQMDFSRRSLTASSQSDSFYIYAGPKNSRELAKYDDPTANGFKRSASDFEAAMEGVRMLGWLEFILKWALNIFYGFVGNYGVAIILVTILVRILLFPLTFKGSQATARMQELQPKMQELQAKYKGNPQKLNQEMALFYKNEGFNPLAGCLPMLIQFPLFIAMYSLFNNHFDLRGAMFIPGWIHDLSLPESVYDFPTLNLLLWSVSAIRILPIIYVASQLLYGKFMQQPASGAQNAGQMKFMMYGIPIIFFFVLYDVPSGLLVYWIASNIFTILQQIVMNRVIHKKRLAAGQEVKTNAPAKPVKKAGKRRK